ncbi:hypothetical protein BGZ50_003573 [Haplosporangium sp. Z 11]|nr:hypothetical protein BGZ50_003573 [Haplosporangium sp. Z 11]
MSKRPQFPNNEICLPNGIRTLGYLSESKVAEWSLEDFLQTGQHADVFINALDSLYRNKNVTVDIRFFAKNLHTYYTGTLGPLVVETEKARAVKEVNRLAMCEHEQAIVQKRARSEYEKELILAAPTTLRRTSEPLSSSTSSSNSSSSSPLASNSGSSLLDSIAKGQPKTRRGKRAREEGKDKDNEKDRKAEADAATLRRVMRYRQMERSKMWQLSSGTYVEDVLFSAGIDRRANTKIRSYTIDIGCQTTQELFSQEDWKEIVGSADFNLDPLSQSTGEYIKELMKCVQTGMSIMTVNPPDDSYDVYLIRDSFSKWANLYMKDAFTCEQDLSESYWARKGWPALKELLEDDVNIFMVDGEKTAYSSSRRRNKNRSHDERKRFGRRFDLIARDLKAKIDWLYVESMKVWNEQERKYIVETSEDLFRETVSMIHDRITEARDPKHFIQDARFFAIYTGGRAFKSYQIRPRSHYMKVMKAHPTFQLSTRANNLRTSAQGLAHIIQIRAALLNTVRLYWQVPEQEETENWLYDVVDPEDADLALGSSPIAPSP